MNRITLLVCLLLLAWSCQNSDPQNQSDQQPDAIKPPNIILIMADDLGWGDTGYNGHPEIQTPYLDEMAEKGVTFERFYAAAPVCSPTRGSCLTGRNPNRYGIFSANIGSLPQEEITLAELLQAQGYRTGHFGKWHLGTLTKDSLDANRGGKPQFAKHYAPPWQHGFEVCFATESKVPTWDPMQTPEKAAGGVGNQGLGNYFGTAYWNEKGEKVKDNLDGDDSRIIVDRLIPFLEDAHSNEEPFFAVVWFHTPHTPVITGEEYRAKYAHLSEEEQHYYGCITAMDEQIGRIRNKLKELGIHDQTMTFFTSDNGPENDQNRPRSIGITKGLSERKRSLKEGGIRVPGLLEYPSQFPNGKSVETPFFTSDYLPSIVDLLNLDYPNDRPLDGESILPILTDLSVDDRKPLVFRYQKQAAVIDGDYKIYRENETADFRLFNLKNDPAEQQDLSLELPEKREAMIQYWNDWQLSQEESLAGADY